MTDHQLLVGIWFAAMFCLGVHLVQLLETIFRQVKLARFEKRLRQDFQKTIKAAIHAAGLETPADPPEDAPRVH